MDIVFDKVDYQTNKPISIGYSETKDVKSKISKTPLSSLLTVFFSIMAFSTIFITTNNAFEIAQLLLALVGASLMKVRKANLDATKIVKNKHRALEKTNRSLEVFANYSQEQLQTLRIIALGETPIKEEITQEEAL